MGNLLDKVINLGLGAIVMTKEKANEIAKTLVERGEIGQEEASKLINELSEKGKSQSDELKKQIETMIENILKKMDIATSKDIEDLKKEIADLKVKDDIHE